MDSSHIPLIVVIVFLIAASAYFSATETAFSSLNRIRVKSMADEGDKGAQLVLRLSSEYDRLLSTILIGNNIVNICSASIATVLFTALFPTYGVTLSTVVMTVLVLIFGEISPKSLAKESPERFAKFSAPLLNLLIKILAPLNWIFMQWKKLLSRIFPVSDDSGITEEELLTMVDEAQTGGTFNESEGDLIRSAIEFNDLDVVDVFTPRTSIVALSVTGDTEAAGQMFRETGFSRIPVYEENIDHIIGVLHEKDFYNQVLFGSMTIREVLKPALYIPPSTRISALLRLFQQKHTHLAVIDDEYGGTMGIVTMEDIIEELVGEIWDEHDDVEPEVRKLTDGSLWVMGELRLAKLFEEFDLDEPESEMSTVSGWIIEQLDHVPRAQETMEFEGLRFTVLESDTRRVVSVRVEQLAAPEEETNE